METTRKWRLLKQQSKAIGEHVGEALIINDPNEVGNYPTPMYSNMLMKQSSAELMAVPEANINFKKIKLQFDVRVTFEME